MLKNIDYEVLEKVSEIIKKSRYGIHKQNRSIDFDCTRHAFKTCNCTQGMYTHNRPSQSASFFIFHSFVDV